MIPQLLTLCTISTAAKNLVQSNTFTFTPLPPRKEFWIIRLSLQHLKILGLEKSNQTLYRSTVCIVFQILFAQASTVKRQHHDKENSNKEHLR